MKNTETIIGVTLLFFSAILITLMIIFDTSSVEQAKRVLSNDTFYLYNVIINIFVFSCISSIITGLILLFIGEYKKKIK